MKRRLMMAKNNNWASSSFLNAPAMVRREATRVTLETTKRRNTNTNANNRNVRGGGDRYAYGVWVSEIMSQQMPERAADTGADGWPANGETLLDATEDEVRHVGGLGTIAGRSLSR